MRRTHRELVDYIGPKISPRDDKKRDVVWRQSLTTGGMGGHPPSLDWRHATSRHVTWVNSEGYKTRRSGGGHSKMLRWSSGEDVALWPWRPRFESWSGQFFLFFTIFGHILLSLVSLKSLKALNCVYPFIWHHESLPSRFGSRRRRGQCAPG